MTKTQYRSPKIKEIIIKEPYRGLWYEDGVLKQVLEAGRYEYPKDLLFKRTPEVSVQLVDMRERDLTIKGQEILTSDKVAIRVSIVVRFQVVDPTLAMHAVQSYEDRIYTDVQLAARRSLASMRLEEILTNRNKLSEDILEEVKESADGYGVSIGRADVKDLVFPGNLQAIMNQVLTAERQAEAQLIQARARADVSRVDAEARADVRRVEAETQATEVLQQAQSEAEAERIKTEAEVRALRERAEAAGAFTEHPALIRQLELDTLSALAHSATARLYINFDSDMALKHSHIE